MATLQTVAARLRAEFGKDPRIGFTRPPLLAYRNGLLLMEGEAVDVAAKKLALDRAARLPGVAGILDHVLVCPTRPMSDMDMVGAFARALSREPAVAGCTIRGSEAGSPHRALRGEPPDTIVFGISDGVVSLAGQLAGLANKRLIGALAWRLGGTRDVVNAIAVDPPEDDDDDALADAVRLVLAKEAPASGRQLQVDVRGATVFLSGLAPSAAEKEAAARVAWCILGVDEVIDGIMVAAP